MKNNSAVTKTIERLEHFLDAFINAPEISFRETTFPDDISVYTNTGHRIVGQCICEIMLPSPNPGKTRLLRGVSSVSVDDQNVRDTYDGRKRAFIRAIKKLPLDKRKKLMSAFLSVMKPDKEMHDDFSVIVL